MPEIEDLLNELEGPPPASTRFPIPTPRRWPWAVGTVALIAAAIAVFAIPGPRWTASRGEPGRVVVDLRMIVSRDGQAIRVSRDATYHVGETVWFRVAATPTAPVVLRVEGPEGTIDIARVTASPEPVDLVVDGEPVAWRFEMPGRYAFYLLAGDGPCEAPGCTQIALDVE